MASETQGGFSGLGCAWWWTTLLGIASERDFFVSGHTSRATLINWLQLCGVKGQGKPPHTA